MPDYATQIRNLSMLGASINRSVYTGNKYTCHQLYWTCVTVMSISTEFIAYRYSGICVCGICAAS